jgi:hypothetical protein
MRSKSFLLEERSEHGFINDAFGATPTLLDPRFRSENSRSPDEKKARQPCGGAFPNAIRIHLE